MGIEIETVGSGCYYYSESALMKGLGVVLKTHWKDLVSSSEK